MGRSFVHHLQELIRDPRQSLTQLLRETKLIAAKLNLDDVERWVDYELKGYPHGIDVPKYRKFWTHALEIRNPIRGWGFAGNARFSMSAREPISEIERLSKGEMLCHPLQTSENLPVTDSIGGRLGADWPQRLVIDSGQFVAIVESVKQELLEWTIELEKRGIKGEDMSFDEKEKQTATHQTFNIQKFTGVLGNVSNSQVSLYDYSSIHQVLKDHNVPQQQRNELENIMDELKSAPADKKETLTQRGMDWIARNREFLGTATELVQKAFS